jgi:hypothetical protein
MYLELEDYVLVLVHEYLDLKNITIARSSINIVDFVHVREDLVHVLEIVDVQDPVDDVPEVENEDFDDEVVGRERNSRTWTSSKMSSRTI